MAPYRRMCVVAVAVALLVPSATLAAASARTKGKPRTQPAAASTAPSAGPATEPAAQMPALDLSEPPPPPAPVLAAPAPAPVPTPATTEPLLQGEAVAPVAPASDDRIGLSVGAKLALLIPSGRTTDVAVDVGNASSVVDASHSMTGAFGLSLGYGLPFLERALSIRAEGGVYPLSGKGSRDYPNDPDFGQMEYGYKSLSIPLFFGLAFRLPLGLPLELAPTGGFAAVHSTITSTWTHAGESTETAPVSGWALGFYAGLEGALPLGPGALTGEVRYVNARTDLGFKAVPEYGQSFNRDLGDVQGTNVLLGYRFDF